MTPIDRTDHDTCPPYPAESTYRSTPIRMITRNNGITLTGLTRDTRPGDDRVNLKIPIRIKEELEQSSYWIESKETITSCIEGEETTLTGRTNRKFDK